MEIRSLLPMGAIIDKKNNEIKCPTGVRGFTNPEGTTFHFYCRDCDFGGDIDTNGNRYTQEDILVHRGKYNMCPNPRTRGIEKQNEAKMRTILKRANSSVTDNNTTENEKMENDN